MFRIVRVQAITALLVAIAAGLAAGTHAAVTALLGGLAVTVPNGLFALKLAHLARRRECGAEEARRHPGAVPAGAASLLAGELVKVALIAGLLGLLAWADRDAVWPALTLSVCAVLLVQPFALAGRG
jgi:ATP synthase protein I